MPKRLNYKIKQFRLIWRVENFFSAFEESKIICSPSFRVSANYCVSFILTLRNDHILVSVDKNSDLQIELNDCEVEIHNDMDILKFKTGKLADLPGWQFYCDLQKWSNTNSQLIVNSHLFLGQSVPQNKQNPDQENLHLLKLSRDIKELYTSTKFSDVTLHVKNEQFKIHRAILLARSPRMVETLGLDLDSSPTKHVSLYSSSVLKILLEYIYAARIEPMHLEMTDGIHSAIDILQFSKLKEKMCVFPNEISLSSRVISVRTAFTWPISKISNINGEFPKKVMFSPLLCSSFSDQRQFEICLELTSYLNNTQSINVSSRLHYGHSSAMYSLETTTSIVDVFGESQYSQNHKFSIGKSDWFSSISKWNKIYSIDKSLLENDKDILQPNDSLTFLFDFVICKTEHDITGSSYSLSPIEDISFDYDDYQELSNDLMDLYISQKLSDLTIKAETRQFKVHSAIIKARAPKLLSNSENTVNESEFEVKDMSSDVLGAMLTYIYSANIKNLRCGLAMKLYLAADKYNMPLLKKLCLEFVKSNLVF